LFLSEEKDIKAFITKSGSVIRVYRVFM